MTRSILASAMFAFTCSAWGADPVPLEPPPLPPQLQSGEAIEPDVTIREEEERTIYEYRRNGQLIMVRVQPRVGPPYFFFDKDGDGDLDRFDGDPRKLSVNQWLLFSW